MIAWQHRSLAIVPGLHPAARIKDSSATGAGNGPLALTVGAGNYPAKFSFKSKTTASCASDFIVYNTGLLGSSGSGGQPSIWRTTMSTPPARGTVGDGACGLLVLLHRGADPNFSGVLRDGSQIAFVQTTGGVASLVLLKWQAGSGLLVDPVTPASNAAYPSCAAPCMTTLALVDASIAASDTHSSVFYDYGDDAAYVGDDSGFRKSSHQYLMRPPWK